MKTKSNTKTDYTDVLLQDQNAYYRKTYKREIHADYPPYAFVKIREFVVEETD